MRKGDEPSRSSDAACDNSYAYYPDSYPASDKLYPLQGMAALSAGIHTLAAMIGTCNDAAAYGLSQSFATCMSLVFWIPHQ